MNKALVGTQVAALAWHDSADRTAPALLSVVVPTFNEIGNVAELVRRLAHHLREIAWEVIFVDDDSPDGTAECVRALARSDPRVRCIHRIGRRGLSSACIEGVMASSAPFVAVMDADLQHDESILPQMLRALHAPGVDIAVGSRYVAGGSVGQWAADRASISRLATRLSHLVVPAQLQDPMSGFFMMRREAFLARVRQLSALGFKILMDLFASGQQSLRFVEIPYVFGARHAGDSKLDNQAVWDYAMLLFDKLVGHVVPVRFIAFALIGGLGVVVHLLVLSLAFRSGSTDFTTGQALAASLAMVFNFSINNLITYRDRQLKGWPWLRGLASFMLACGVGALANVGIAGYLFSREQPWLASALAGIAVSVVWNFSLTSQFTWRK